MGGEALADSLSVARLNGRRSRSACADKPGLDGMAVEELKRPQVV
jgi:hypothetical protein